MRLLSATALLLFAARPAAAQQRPIILRPMELEVGVRGRGLRSSVSRQGHLEEWIGARLRGAIVDPRLLRFSLTVRPRLTQSRLGAAAEPTGSNATWLGLDVQVQALPGRPLSTTFRTARYALDQNGYGLYGDLSTRNTFTEAAVRYDNRYLPLQFRFTDETWGHTSPAELATGAFPTRIRTILLAGGNRKTTFTLQQNTNRDGTSLRLRLAEFQNRQQWGKGSSLLVTASAVGQWGEARPEGRQTQLGAAVHLQHLRAVWSDWSVSRQTSRADTLRAGGETYAGGIGWRATPGLTVGVAGLRGVMRAMGFTDRQLRVGPNAALDLALPLGSHLSASAGVAYQRFSGTVAPDAAFAALGEPHVVDPGGSFLLDFPDAETGSVTVRSRSGTVYLPGADYETAVVGGYTQVTALPGGRLAPGQSVLVDYRYHPADVPDATALWTNYAGELQVRWLRAYHRRWRVAPDQSDPGGPLNDRQRTQDHITTGARLAVPIGRVTANVLAERQHRRLEGNAITATSVSAGANTRLAARMRLGIGADYLHSRSAVGVVDRLGARSQLDWALRPTLRLGASLAGWRAVEDHAVRRIRVGGAAQVAWQPGLLRAAVYYAYQDWRDRVLAVGAVTGRPMHFLVIEIGRRF